MVRIFSLVLLLLALPALAVIETYEFSDSALEKRYRALSEELRCPKCQNQNIADSNAPISQDLRRLLYEQLEQGASDERFVSIWWTAMASLFAIGPVSPGSRFFFGWRRCCCWRRGSRSL